MLSTFFDQITIPLAISVVGLGMIAHFCNPSTGEGEARSSVPG
jgi:hypothetical protein